MSKPPSAMPPSAAPAPFHYTKRDPDDLADQLIGIHEEMKAIIGDPNDTKDSLYSAAKRVNDHRTGANNDPSATDELAYQHSRMHVLLCGAVGVNDNIPDYADEAKAAAAKAGVTYDQPISPAKPSEKDEKKGRHPGPGEGRFVGSSLKDTMSWLAFNVGDRKRIDGRDSLMSVDPDYTDSGSMIAKELDTQALPEVIEALEAKHQKRLEDPTYKSNNNPKDLSEFDKRKEKIDSLKKMQVEGTTFRTLVNKAENIADIADKDIMRRRKRQMGVGSWSTNRHNEASQDELFLIGGLAAKLGIPVMSLKVMMGFDSPRFQVIGQRIEDPKTGKVSTKGHVVGIPLYNNKGIQRCAGMLIAMHYAPQYGKKPVLEMEPDWKIDPATGKPEIDPATKKKVPQKDADGKTIYTDIPAKDDKGNVIFAKDKEGKIVYRALTEDEREKVIKEPFPSFTIPSGYPDHSIRFLMDMLVQHAAMGGEGLLGYNPVDGSFDPNADPSLDDVTAQMSPATKRVFMEKLQKHGTQYYRHAQARYQKNILNPKIFEASQASRDYAIARIQTEYAQKNKGMAIHPGNITEDQIIAMQKKPLNPQEMQDSLNRHNSLPKKRREQIEQEMTQQSYMDTGRGSRSSSAPSLAVATTPPAAGSSLAVAGGSSAAADALTILSSDDKTAMVLDIPDDPDAETKKLENDLKNEVLVYGDGNGDAGEDAANIVALGKLGLAHNDVIATADVDVDETLQGLVDAIPPEVRERNDVTVLKQTIGASADSAAKIRLTNQTTISDNEMANSAFGQGSNTATNQARKVPKGPNG